MTLRLHRLEFGALAVAALAAVYGIWLAVGLPPLPLGIHVGRSPIDVPSVVQLANGPLRGTQPTVRPLATTPGRPGRLELGTALSSRFATAPTRTRTRTVTPSPAAPAPSASRAQTVGDSIHAAVAAVAGRAAEAPPATTPLPPVTAPDVTLTALPSTPPVPSLPQVPQAPSPPPVAPPATPPLPPVP